MAELIDEARLAEIEARANAATPGPWRAGTVEAEGKVWARDPTALGGPSLGERCVFDANPHYPHNANRAFIAHARTDVPDLVAEVRRLTAALATARREGAREMRSAIVCALTPHEPDIGRLAPELERIFALPLPGDAPNAAPANGGAT